MNSAEASIGVFVLSVPIAVYGMYSDFAPTEVWAFYVGCASIFVAFCLLAVITYYLVRGMYLPPRIRNLKGRLSLALVPPMLVGGVAFMVLGFGMPSIITGLVGEHVELLADARGISTIGGRYIPRTKYKLRVDLPNGLGTDFLYVSNEMYREAKGGVQVRIVGKRSTFGVYIQQWYIVKAANHSLEGRRP